VKARASAPRAASSAPVRTGLAPTRGWDGEPGAGAAAGHDLAAVSVQPPATGAAPIQRTFATRTGAQDKARLDARRVATAARRKAFREENRRKIQEMRAQRPRRRRRQFPPA
jgi:hypothetical protein